MELTTSIAAPLLAGFSITLVGVVAQASEHFRFPGTCVMFLALSAVLLLVCVQCGFWARQYLTTPSETKNWYDDIDYVTQADTIKEAKRQCGRLSSVDFSSSLELSICVAFVAAWRSGSSDAWVQYIGTARTGI